MLVQEQRGRTTSSCTLFVLVLDGRFRIEFPRFVVVMSSPQELTQAQGFVLTDIKARAKGTGIETGENRGLYVATVDVAKGLSLSGISSGPPSLTFKRSQPTGMGRLRT